MTVDHNPRLTRRGPWLNHPACQGLPIVEGTLIRLQVERLPGDRAPKPLWLWTSRPTATTTVSSESSGRDSSAS